jgi:hypothetical protein
MRTRSHIRACRYTCMQQSGKEACSALRGRKSKRNERVRMHSLVVLYQHRACLYAPFCTTVILQEGIIASGAGIEAIPCNKGFRTLDRQTDRQTDRQIDRHTDTQTHTDTHRHTHRHTYTHTHTRTNDPCIVLFPDSRVKASSSSS